MWDNHVAEVYAQGKHYGYGADVRVDSDPVGPIRSLHYSIYKGMESKLASCEKALAARESTRPGLEKMATSRFTKTGELEQKEARYKEVVEAIREYNKKHQERVEERRLDWEALGGWTIEKVMQEVERHFAAGPRVIVAEQGEGIPRSAILIGERVKTLYALELPQKLLKNLNEQLCQGKLKSETVMKMVDGAIKDFESRGPSWCEGNGDGLAGSYRQIEGRNSAGDVLVRGPSSSDRKTYRAFLVAKGGLEKYLGCDESVTAVKERARRFYIFNNVAARLADNLATSDVIIVPAGGQQNRRSAGLEY